MSETKLAAIRSYAAERRFSAATLDRWLRLDVGDRAILLALVQRLRLGENQFRDFLDWSEEIAARDRCSIADLWRRPPLADALARDLGRNQTIAALKAALRRVRFPRLTAAEARLAALIRGLRLPRNVQLHLPENLEGEEVRVEMHARSAAALRECTAALQQATSSADLDEIFRLLQDAP
jgi:hypothetical protein